ncbi:magnesium chelatase-related protein [Acetobacter nitrogenifigens DSM 23921 = NBRC 105050]|uniref:ATPase AAA n=1 Tax=Acetobacter nitrogenifigens DSM 23921 = NBRC 105050 TaxID=1120919 RepID=A0A511XEB2_9PROT|nr:YifB family Mg chelatase-like AAA ATPase [Acetobacter nitrogenifigens]GBQ88158.1 magnesium chelatase-related protein [Acetobacter nitrogenifigens DSM 23921 = NBRC 105050]GEN61288.1 ATPase AAA [Acetobacter nitrogenifigens DSM 23921 = NBRC 105050]
MINARVRSFAFLGIEAAPVWVEVQIASGLPAFLIVGLPDKAVGEARERVRAALTSMGLALPPKRILINLVPADLLKEGSHFDLPIALAVLAAMEVLPIEELGRYAVLGELSLDGGLNRVAGVLSASISAAALKLGLICPAAQATEAVFGGDIDILAAPDLVSLVNHFRGVQVLSQPALPSLEDEAPIGPDLADVKGMAVARRALEIAAAGGHSMLMSGPPGSGKSMLASRLPGLLPPLSKEETLEVTRIYSAAGLLTDGRPLLRPPFRDPHHSATQPALIGGGARAKPGEVSLAHRGVLFLDELPEFSRQALESLRQPLELGRTTIARAAAHITYPARFQLIAAMNPCRCGYLGDTSRECRKAPRCGEDYLSRLSGPLLDRIDLWVDVQPLSPLSLMQAPSGESSEVVAARVVTARARQSKRTDGLRNAEVSTQDFELSSEAKSVLEDAARKLRLSARGFTRLLRVARTIADLDDRDLIEARHVTEAIGLRPRHASLL